MSDNQSWNSSGSEEDIEPLEEPGHHVGAADLSGVLSKVSHIWAECFWFPSPPLGPVRQASASPLADGSMLDAGGSTSRR